MSEIQGDKGLLDPNYGLDSDGNDVTPVTPEQPATEQADTFTADDLVASDAATQADEDILKTIDDAQVQVQTTEKAPTEDTDALFDSEKFQSLANQFKEYMGIDLKDAVKQYHGLHGVAKQLQQNAQRATSAIEVRTQKLELMATMMTEPEVMQRVATGTPLAKQVDERIQTVLEVYKRLDPQRRQKVDRLGVKGINDLYSVIQQRKGSISQPLPAVNSVPSANSDNGELMKLSEIMNHKDEQWFRTVGVKLLADRKFINDTVK